MIISSAGQTAVPSNATTGHRILVWSQTATGQPLPAAADEVKYLQQLPQLSTTALDVEVIENGCWSELPAHLRRFAPTVLHYIGHGKRGSLLALDRGSTGVADVVEIGPESFAEMLREAGGSLTGVFLNGCQTAHWAPHLIPSDGWIVGMNLSIDDDVATEFSTSFYTKLAEGRSSDEAFNAALVEIQTHRNFEMGMFVRWTEDPEPDDFLHKVFSRQAFLTSTLEEGSLLDLSDALQGVRQALNTRGMALRSSLSGQVSCRTPLDEDIVKPLLARLRVAEGDLKQLRRQFPAVVKYGDGWMNVQSDEIPNLLSLADRLDRSRNELLEIVNRSLPAHKRFPLITLTSATGRWGGGI